MKGYLAGYRDGVQDAISGKVTSEEADVKKLPVQTMGLSARACNSLVYGGCSCIGDVIALSSSEIMKMRNVGEKTASEIARWLVEHGILYSAWSEYLYADDIGLDCQIVPGGEQFVRCHQFLNWWQQMSTGHLHLNGFEPYIAYQKRKTTP